MDHYLMHAQVEEWYQHVPLGTMHDVHMTDADHRHVQLMGQDALTAAEELELNTLTDAFVSNLHHEVHMVMQ